MTEAWEKIRAILDSREMTRADLARAIGVSMGTLRNWKFSKRVRQKITDFCAEKIFEDTKISGHLMLIPAGCVIQLSTENQALEFAQELGANVLVEGKEIRFVVPVRLIVAVQLPIAVSGRTQSARNRKISASSRE